MTEDKQPLHKVCTTRFSKVSSRCLHCRLASHLAALDHAAHQASGGGASASARSEAPSTVSNNDEDEDDDDDDDEEGEEVQIDEDLFADDLDDIEEQLRESNMKS